MREQDQIYGRTCRNGELGSVQLVLLVPEAAKEDRYLKPFLVLQLLMQGRRLSRDGPHNQLNWGDINVRGVLPSIDFLSKTNNTSAEKFVQLRLEQTAEELWHLESVTLAQVECAASLFDEFRQKMQEMWNKLKLKDRKLAASMANYGSTCMSQSLYHQV